MKLYRIKFIKLNLEVRMEEKIKQFLLLNRCDNQTLEEI
jgi:hypothetical protein